MSNQKLALTIPEVCESLGLGRNSIQDEINSGALRSFRVGRRRLVSADALAEFVRSREADTPAIDAADGGARREHARHARLKGWQK